MTNDHGGRRPARRTFLLRSGAVLASLPAGARVALAQDAKKVDMNSPQAKALNYHHDAKQVKDPKHKEGQFCHNCQFFQSDKKTGWGPCTLFGGQLVAAEGWCNAWVKKA